MFNSLKGFLSKVEKSIDNLDQKVKPLSEKLEETYKNSQLGEKFTNASVTMNTLDL